MKNTFFKTSCLILLVVVAFVYFANPIFAKASTADMDYIETDMTTSEVAELFAVPAAFLPAALVIIGFIVLTYCTLRNVQVPVSFSSQSSFLDKCTQLGQYVVDNITDPIKDFLYSVYSYAQDNNLTSITGIAAFTAVNIGMFFHAIAQWIGGSLISNVSPIGEGLLNQFESLNFSGSVYSYTSNVYSAWDNSVIPLSSCFFTAYNQSGAVNYIDAFTFNPNYDYSDCCVVFVNGEVQVYKLIGSVAYRQTGYTFYRYTAGFNGSSISVAPPSSLYVRDYVRQFFGGAFVSSTYYYAADYLSQIQRVCADWSIPFYVYNIDVSFPDEIPLSNLSTVDGAKVTPWSDQIYQPADDELEIDPDGVGEVLGGAVAGLTLGELINLLTQGKTLTLDSALESQKIVGGGDYVFPSMNSIWKYPQYFYDMLKGWGTFVGGCLSAVTVGDGGLSWIFYGGFVLLICGGIIGKILLG